MPISDTPSGLTFHIFTADKQGMPFWPWQFHHRFLKLCWIAGLGLLLAGHDRAWSHENSKSNLDCIIHHLVPKNGHPSLLKFSEMRQQTGNELSKESPTVQIVGRQPGSHDGKLHVIEKTGGHWYSGYASQKFAPQGDPNWFPLIGGVKTAYFFGFRRISTNRMTAPNVKEVSGAISKLNIQLAHHHEELIGVGFYPAPHNVPISDEQFLRKFAWKKLIPMAVDGLLAIHDISYHLVALFLPNRVIDHGARLTQRLLDFVDFARKQASDNPHFRWLVEDGTLESFIEQRAAEVDNLGDISALKTSQIIGELPRNDYVRAYADFIYAKFSANGASPNRYLMNLTGSAQAESRSATPVERLKAQQLSDLAKLFIQKHPERAADQGLELSPETVLKQTNRKRGSIAKAVMSFSQ